MTKKPTVQTEDKYVLRLPDGMRDRIKKEAERSGRSMNAEIVQRLEDFPNVMQAWETESRARAKLADDKERLESELHRLEEVRDRFFDKDGKQKPVLTIPQALVDRIRFAAEQNHRTIDAEAQVALETAFPPQSIDVNLLSAFLASLIGVSAPDGDKDYLKYINNALAKAKDPWTVQAGWDGEISFYPYGSPTPEDEDGDEGKE